MSKYAKFSHLIIKVRTLALKSLQNLPISSTVFHLFSKRVMFDEKAWPFRTRIKEHLRRSWDILCGSRGWSIKIRRDFVDSRDTKGYHGISIGVKGSKSKYKILFFDAPCTQEVLHQQKHKED